jgi:phosphoribosyl-ATP pyrophosphohydrolase
VIDHHLDALAELASEIESRKAAAPELSYTAKLLSQGAAKCAKKFGEEAVELAIAAVQNEASQVTAEAADVLYHFLVLLTATNVPLGNVMNELARRRGTSGLDEKAARKPA